METKKCIETRHSVRKFTEEPVSRQAVEELVHLASCAPSWKNTQVVRYYAVEDPEIKKNIAENCVLGFVYNTKTIMRAPLLMVLTCVHGISGFEKDGEPTTGKGDRWEVFDGGIAAQTLSLAAHDMGLGAVIMGIFDDKKVAEALGCPEEEIPMALIALGHPAAEAKGPGRKDVSELLTWK